MDESNATCGKRLDSIGVENTEDNRRAYRQLLISAPGLGQYCSGAILFEETLFQDTTDGKRMVDVLNEQVMIRAETIFFYRLALSARLPRRSRLRGRCPPPTLPRRGIREPAANSMPAAPPRARPRDAFAH